MVDPVKRTASEKLGEVDAGQAGDKVEGVDPATAPMETDAEAGGTPTEPLTTSPVPSKGDANATSYASAMRRPEGNSSKLGTAKVVALILAAIVIVIFVAAAVAMAS